MLSCNTSSTSTASLPRIKKKTKTTPLINQPGPSGLQDVPLDLGFRDESRDRRSRSKRLQKDTKSRSHKDRDLSRGRSGGRDNSEILSRVGKVSQQTRKVSQQSGKVSQQSEKVSQQSGKVSQQSGSLTRRSKKDSETKKSEKVSQQTGKISKLDSRRSKLPLGPKSSRSPDSVKRARDDLRSQLRSASPVMAPPPPPAAVSSGPSALPDGAQMTFTYDAMNQKWVLPSLPGFSFVFTGQPAVPVPSTPPPTPVVSSVGASKSSVSGLGSRKNVKSGHVSSSDDDVDDNGADSPSPAVDYSRDRDYRKGQGPSSCAVSTSSDCTTAPSRDSSDVDDSDNGTASSATPRRQSSGSSSSSSSDSSTDSESSKAVESSKADDRDDDPDALKINTDEEFSASDAEGDVIPGGYVVNDANGGNGVDGDNGRVGIAGDDNRVEDGIEVEDEAEVAPAGHVGDPQRVVNPPQPVVDEPPVPVVAELNDDEFVRILNDLIGRDVPHAEVDAFRRDVPRHAWNGTVNVIQRQNREREHFRARIRYLRGLVEPSRDEKAELQNMIIFQ